MHIVESAKTHLDRCLLKFSVKYNKVAGMYNAYNCILLPLLIISQVYRSQKRFCKTFHSDCSFTLVRADLCKLFTNTKDLYVGIFAVVCIHGFSLILHD